MHPFAFSRAATLAEGIEASAREVTAVVAGGTELVNWLKEGIATPARITDINRLPDLSRIEADEQGLRIGALARMSEVAASAKVQRDYPAIREALLKSASAQLRNMASMGGNLLQRTRCPYFRAETELPCNKRRAGSGCSALEGEDRSMAIFGWSEHCIATHPSDVAVALVALNASVRLQSATSSRTIPLVEFHRLPDTQPERDTVLAPGELIVGIEVPASPAARRSHYLKLRERASYEFALVSVAVALGLDGRRIETAQIALGGVAHKPWRLTASEVALQGVNVDDAAALRTAVDRGFEEARPRRHNGFKVELATRMVVRALQSAASIP